MRLSTLTRRKVRRLKVYKIDRLARSLIDLLSILEKIQKAGAAFQSFSEPVDSTKTGAFELTLACEFLC